MESENSDSRSVSALQVDSGTNLGLGLKKELQKLVKPRAKRMNGEEKKSESKKRLKSVQIGLNLDDEEPIGALLKVKKPRNPKTVKLGLDGGGKKGKLVEVREEKLTIEDDDLGGMNDTLASFRKKLKGPKIDSGSGIGRGRSTVLNVAQSPDQLTRWPVEDGGLDAKLASNIPLNGQGNGCDELDVTMDKRLGNKRKGKVKRPKVASMGKTIGGHDKPGDGLKNQKEPGLLPTEGFNLSLAENLEDSLSTFFKKSQSGLIRKSHTSSRVKPKNTARSLDDGLSPVSGADSVTFRSVMVSKLQSASDPPSKLTCKNLKSEDSAHKVSGSCPIDSTAEQGKSREYQKFKDGLFQVSDEDNEVAIQFLYSVPPVTGDTARSSDNELNRYSKALLGDPAPYPLSVRSLSEGIQECRTVDHGGSNNGCSGDTEEFICAQRKDNCYAPNALEIRTLDDRLKQCSTGKASDLVYDVVEMSNSVSSLKQNEEIHGFGEVESNALDEQPKSVLTMYPLSVNPEICSSLAEKDGPVPQFDDELLNNPVENTSKEVNKLHSGTVLEASSTSLSQNSLNVGENLTDCDGANTSTKEPDLVAVPLRKENDIISDGRLTPITTTSGGAHESGFSLRIDNLEKSLETHDDANPSYSGLHPNESVASIEKSRSDNQPSDDEFKGTCVPNLDPLLVNEEDGVSSPSPCATPNQNESHLEDAVSAGDPESKDNKLSAVQRIGRNAKKRRHGDMAYEGDADWDILVHEQGFLDSHQVVDSGRPFRAREKLDSSSNIDTNAEHGGVAAVSAGLKARAAGPVEKIKFKEVLKRKGGLQEYLECRNQILGLWSKDVGCILTLSDCGVTETPPEDELARASLIREIYTFLDQSGYINFGIASEKKKVEPMAVHNYKLLKEEEIHKKSGALVTESEDEVSFILGRFKGPETSMEVKNAVIFDNGNQISKATEGRGFLPLTTSQLPAECDECPADKYQGNCCIDEKLPNSLINTEQSCELLDTETIPVIPPELTNELYNVQSLSNDKVGGNTHLQSDLDVGKRIIVVGAGPAGLTAARHLQRQGFSVTVLEARSRIGGRVYTDRSSLSVPVDLGASIITGVEADVATERRPDPSSLICAQLGLELTVLNSDCPLYDIITGDKVPADLDEALEAEYNSLLDDMVLLVAQQGEHAMKMSLEDGLEYALKRRRTARLGSADEETELQNSVDAFFDSKRINVDGRFPEKICSKEDILSPRERRVMNWHFANLEYGCAALLKEVSLPHWNQDDIYGGFGGAHCMIKGGYSSVVETLGVGLSIHLNHVVTNISYCAKDSGMADGNCNNVKVSTSNGSEFLGDAVLITVPLGCLKAGTIQFSPPLPHWKHSSIQRLGFGVLNKVVLEFQEVFWDDSVDYFGATAEETNQRGQCFMFWNVRKTVGAPVLIALVVGKAAIYGQNMSSSDHVNHALMVLRKLFGEASVPDPVASVVTNWGKDPFSYGAYSYVAVGSSGEDYDILGRPVGNCLFFAGEATCKEHPDTVGGAMMSGLREAVRIIDILSTGNDCTAEVEAMEAAQRQSDSERDEVRDITKRLDAVELSNVLYSNSVDAAWILSREALLQELFVNAKTTAGRLCLAKELLNLRVETLKSFAGTREGLTILNSWILDSMGKDGTQLLRHCVRLLVLVSTDLLAVRLSGIGKTVKEKVCVHTSRDIRAIASQLVSVWLEVFRKEKASIGGMKLPRHTTAVDSSKGKYLKDSPSGKPPLRMHGGVMDNKRSLQLQVPFPSNSNLKKVNGKQAKLETTNDSKSEANSSRSGGSIGRLDTKVEDDKFAISEEEQAVFAAAEAARAAAHAAAEAFASEAKCNALLQLPKIPSFHKFARREQYAQMDESDLRRRWSGGILGRQDCISEIDSRNCRVRDWSIDFSAACVKLDSSRMSVDNLSQRSHSNEIASQWNFREQSGESAAIDSSLLTKAWVDSAGSVGIKDYHAIERWQSQAAAADSDLFYPTMHLNDEEDSNTISKPPIWKHERLANESSVSQVTTNKELQPRGAADLIKQAVVDYVASLLMPLYKARKIDKEGYKSIMKKTATKVMEQATDAEKAMAVSEFLDFKRRNKIRSFVDKLIERHMAVKPAVKHH